MRSAVHTHLERVLEHFDALPADRAAAVGGRAMLLARAAEAAWLSGAFQHSVALAEECLNDVNRAAAGRRPLGAARALPMGLW